MELLGSWQQGSSSAYAGWRCLKEEDNCTRRPRNRAKVRYRIGTAKMELYWVKVGLNVAGRWSRADGEDEELSR